MSKTAGLEDIRLQFPDVKLWTFVGRSGGKRIKGQMFPRGVAIPVWDTKTQKLLKRLPYMKQVSEDEIKAGVVKRGREQVKKHVEIPADWENMHHKRKIALAKALSNEDVTSVARANEIITQNLAAKLKQEAPAPAPVVDQPEPASDEDGEV